MHKEGLSYRLIGRTHSPIMEKLEEISAGGKKMAPADGATPDGGGGTVATAEARNAAEGEAGLAADAAVLRGKEEAANVNVDKLLPASTTTADDVAVTEALSDRKIGTKQQRSTQSPSTPRARLSDQEKQRVVDMVALREQRQHGAAPCPNSVVDAELVGPSVAPSATSI
jgi:hypothetical protein